LGGARQRSTPDPVSRAAQQEARARKEREAVRKADEVKRARLRELRVARDAGVASAAVEPEKRTKVAKA
jgi:hypothetical protein